MPPDGPDEQRGDPPAEEQTPSPTAEADAAADVPAAGTILERIGFDPEESVLTRRQAEVLALRERGLAQATIADRLGTSRANVSSVEASARRNVKRAEATVSVAAALTAPVRLHLEPGTDVYEVPDRLYAACDDAEIKVDAATPEVIAEITEQAGTALDGRQIAAALTVAVTPAGTLQVRQS